MAMEEAEAMAMEAEQMAMEAEARAKARAIEGEEMVRAENPSPHGENEVLRSNPKAEILGQ